jgi:fatty acid desaturase
VSIVFGFTGQSLQVLRAARTSGMLTARQHRLAIAETLLGVAWWGACGVAVGAVPFLFVYVLPLLVGNAIVMAFIVTNHSLSPLTPVNDPLANSLSVTLPRPLEWLTLDFGYHVEHHVFPALSMRHGWVVRDVLRARLPVDAAGAGAARNGPHPARLRRRHHADRPGEWPYGVDTEAAVTATAEAPRADEKDRCGAARSRGCGKGTASRMLARDAPTASRSFH